MGMELVVAGAAASSLTLITEAIARAGVVVTVIMIDGGLVAPGAPMPTSFSDVRLRGAEGTVTLARRGADLAVVVFGNADAALQALQARIAAALK